MTPQLALFLGMLASLLPLGSRRKEACKRLSAHVLQFSLVGLAFTIDAPRLLSAGGRELWLPTLGVVFTLVCGFTLVRALALSRVPGMLMTMGTAICGASAMAALAATQGHSALQLIAPLLSLQLINLVSIYLMPWLGAQLGMSQADFGVWCGMSLMDTSSVVAAAQAYGEEALKAAVPVKAMRILWIIPLLLGASLLQGKRWSSLKFPWYILAFLAVLLANPWLGLDSVALSYIQQASKAGFALTLFLLGVAFEVKRLREVETVSLGLGFFLWLLLSGFSWLMLRFF